MPTPKRKTEYAHVGSLDGSDFDHPKLTASNTKRYGSYLVRAPPSARRVGPPAATKQPVSSRHQGRQVSTRPLGENKRFAVLAPLVEESVQRILTQQKRLSNIATPTKTKSRPSPTSPPSANSSQRRSLSRFTKELERYCVAASANGTAPLPLSTPTVSESLTTLGTVTEFLPYHRQFKAAGLAVTSREQMPRISESMQSQLPGSRHGKTRGTGVAGVQIDGSTVAPSEQGLSPQDPAAPAVPDKDEDVPSSSQGPAQASTSQARPAAKSFIPFLRNNDTVPMSRTHSGRKFSESHIHPSLATPAEPYLTPSDRLRLIDSYFDAPESTKPRDEQPATQRTSISSPVSSKISSTIDKPLPKQPAIKRRPIPPRSERRHMENTAEWPTAGVIIHDNYPLRTSRDELMVALDEQPPAPGKDSSSAHSWTTEEDLPEQNLPEAALPGKPKRTPPVPPKDMANIASTLNQDKPNTPPKNDPPKKPDLALERRHHPEHTIRNKWFKATGLRRRSSTKPLIMSSAIRQESRTSPEEVRKPSSGLPSQKDKPGPDSSAPQLPVTFPSRAETSSSFEKALDAVVSRLDAMEEKRQYERETDLEATRVAITKSESPQETSSKATNLTSSSAPSSARQASAVAPETDPPSDAAGYLDSGIDDRDILLGLKMAICAACDEDLDAWICSKTGLRLRRFLADLKAFESVSRDRKPSVPQPISRRIRRHGRESKRLQSERETRKRNSKRYWTPCFGADGQGPQTGSSQES